MSIMPTRYKNFFIGKENDLFKIEHGKINNIPFELDLQNLGTTFEIWAKYLHLEISKHTVQGVHSVQYDDSEDDSFPVHSITSEEKCQVCGRK